MFVQSCEGEDHLSGRDRRARSGSCLGAESVKMSGYAFGPYVRDGLDGVPSEKGQPNAKGGTPPRACRLHESKDGARRDTECPIYQVQRGRDQENSYSSRKQDGQNINNCKRQRPDLRFHGVRPTPAVSSRGERTRASGLLDCDVGHADLRTTRADHLLAGSVNGLPLSTTWTARSFAGVALTTFPP